MDPATIALSVLEGLLDLADADALLELEATS